MNICMFIALNWPSIARKNQRNAGTCIDSKVRIASRTFGCSTAAVAGPPAAGGARAAAERAGGATTSVPNGATTAAAAPSAPLLP